MTAPWDLGEAAETVRERLAPIPSVAVVLGSGLSHLAEDIAAPREIRFEEIPGFPASGVAGHSGRLVAGELDGVPVLLQAGRYHAYEGHPMELVVAPVRLLAGLGVEVLVVTNAAGGIDGVLGPGDLVVLEDHINMMFRNPLIGPVAAGETRFPDMSAPYAPELRELALDVARALGVDLRVGVYAAVLGPSYETAAEVRMLAKMGATVVGMSTVPEVITAQALGIRCLGFSMVTNKGTGLSEDELDHAEVIAVGRAAGERLGAVISGVVAKLAEAQSTEAK